VTITIADEMANGNGGMQIIDESVKVCDCHPHVNAIKHLDRIMRCAKANARNTHIEATIRKNAERTVTEIQKSIDVLMANDSEQ
jgi:hypothetical protein